jgi:putative N6-adenine-specific DNA methylase
LYGTWWKQSNYDDSNNHHKPHLNDNHRATTTTRLLDPFCGSGTIPIEGAAMLAGLPPGRLRHAPLEGTVWYNPTEWNQLVTNSISNNNNNNTKSLGSKLIGASDRDAGAMTAAKENAKRAGVYDWIDFQHCALKSQPWLMGHNNKTQHNNSDSDNTLSTTEESEEEEKESPLWIVTNPPYGKRIRGSGGGGASSLLPLYQTLGHSIRHFNHVDVALYTQDVTLARRTGIPNINPIFTAPHGGLRVTAMSTTGANTIQTNHDDDETK